MPNTNDLYNQMMGLEKQSQAYEGNSVTAPDVISRAINEKFAYGKPILAEAAKWENMAYQQPGKLMEAYNPNSGPTAGAMLGSMLNKIGSGFQKADLARSLANRQAGSLADIASSILGQYQQYGQNLQNRYARLAPLYELGIQQQENEKNRALQRALSARQAQDFTNIYKLLQGQGRLGAGANLEGPTNPYAPPGNTIPMSYAPTSNNLYGGGGYIANPSVNTKYPVTSLYGGGGYIAGR